MTLPGRKHTRISVLQPGATKIRILLIDDMLHVLEMLLDMVGVHDSRDSSTNRQDADLPRIWSMKDNVWVMLLSRSPFPRKRGEVSLQRAVATVS